MKSKFGFLCAVIGLFGINASAEPLALGAPAPQITAPDQDGKPVNFADVYAKGITLVYFYPKADTPGCTAQACSLRDAYSTLTGEGVQIIGVSSDTSEAQKDFQSKFNLPFTLIADTDGSVAKAFQVDLLPGSQRTKRESFLIKDGKVVWSSLKAQTSGHAQEVQAALDALK